MCVSKNVCVCGLQRSGINSSDVEVLTLTNVTEQDAGEYVCKASNYIGEVSQSGWLTVITGNLWDLTHLHSLPTFRCGFIGFDPDLLCCGGPAGGPLVVLVSQSVFPLYVAPLCFSCSPTPPSLAGNGEAMEALDEPAHLDIKIDTASIFSLCELCQGDVWCCSVLHARSVFCMWLMCGLDLPFLSRFCGWWEPFGYLFLVHLFCFPHVFGGILGSICIPLSSPAPSVPNILSSRWNCNDGYYPAPLISLLVLWGLIFFSFSLSLFLSLTLLLSPSLFSSSSSPPLPDRRC